jgi:hypothetical protein
MNFFPTCDAPGMGATIVPSDGSAIRLESVIDGDVGYDFGDDQEDRKGGNCNLKGFFAFFFRSERPNAPLGCWTSPQSSGTANDIKREQGAREG